MDENPEHRTTRFTAACPMGHTSRSSSATVLPAPQSDDAYTRLAEMAAREAEIHASEAAERRAWRETSPARRVVHSIGVRLAEPEPVHGTEREAAPAPHAEAELVDTRLKELEERERALADRERLIATLETLLDRSRQRLEERLAQLDQRIAALTPTRV
jgi:hypothetical protein